MQRPAESPTIPAAAGPDLERRRRISRLMIFFALGYFTEGVGQQGGLISQPLFYFAKHVYHWSPSQVSGYIVAVAWLPWVIKPLYGIVSDFLPLFGYRRKAYLIASNLLASFAYLALADTVSPSPLIFLLLLTAYGMAVSSMLYGALLVENGHEFTASAAFVNQQWLWFNIAQVGVTLLGGALVEYLPATSALHWAALITATVPLCVVIATPILVEEDKTPVSLEGLKKAFHALLNTFKRKELWVIAAFLFVYRMNPGIGQSTAFYYYLTDHMKFSQGFIGILASIIAGGWIVGALLYRRFLPDISSKRLLNLSIALGIVSAIAYFFLQGTISAIWISAVFGMAFAVNYVASISIAADYCPAGAEGFAFAILMSVDNLGSLASDNAGSYLYEHVFHGALPPLILVSAAATAVAFFLVPMLKLGDKKQGQPYAQMRSEAS